MRPPHPRPHRRRRSGSYFDGSRPVHPYLLKKKLTLIFKKWEPQSITSSWALCSGSSALDLVGGLEVGGAADFMGLCLTAPAGPQPPRLAADCGSPRGSLGEPGGHPAQGWACWGSPSQACGGPGRDQEREIFKHLHLQGHGSHVGLPILTSPALPAPQPQDGNLFPAQTSSGSDRRGAGQSEQLRLPPSTVTTNPREHRGFSEETQPPSTQELSVPRFHLDHRTARKFWSWAGLPSPWPPIPHLTHCNPQGDRVCRRVLQDPRSERKKKKNCQYLKTKGFTSKSGCPGPGN